MQRPLQPICPLRGDAKCVGAVCALSLAHHSGVTDELHYSCALAGEGHDRAVIDRREPAKDPVGRT